MLHTHTAGAVDSPTTSDMQTELASLRRELARVRADTRTARILGGFAACAVVLGLLAMRDAAPVAVIQAKRLEIVDDAGRVTAMLSTTPQGGRLDMWDASGANTVRLGSNDLGGDFILWNREGKAVFGAFTQQTGGRMELGTSLGRPGAFVESGPNGGRLALADSSGDPVVAAAAFPTGGMIRVADGQNHDAAILEATATGGALALSSPTGVMMARMRAGELGGEFDLAAKVGTGRVSASASEADSVVIAASIAGAAKIEATKVAGMVDVLNDKGDRIASMESNDGGGLLVCRSGGERPIASVGASPSGGKGGLLQIYNAQQSPVFAAAVNAEGAGRLAIGTAAGVATLTAESGKDDGATISLVRNGKRSLALLAGASGGLLNLFSATGAAVVVAGTADDAAGGAVIIRANEGTDLVRVGVDPKGGGNVVLFNKDATERTTVAGPR